MRRRRIEPSPPLTSSDAPLAAEERLALALELGRPDRTMYAAAPGQSQSQARDHILRSGASGRRSSKAAAVDAPPAR